MDRGGELNRGYDLLTMVGTVRPALFRVAHAGSRRSGKFGSMRNWRIGRESSASQPENMALVGFWGGDPGGAAGMYLV